MPLGPRNFSGGDQVMLFFFHFLRLVLTCWHLGKGENAIHFVSCHQERTKTVCLFLSLRVVKRVRWCIFIFNKWISTSWVVEDTRLCLSKIVARIVAQDAIVISSSILNLWKVFLIIVLLVKMSFLTFKTSLRSGGRPHGDQGFIRFCSSHGVYKNAKQREETETVQQCRKIPSNFVTYHGFYPHKMGAPSQLKLTVCLHFASIPVWVDFGQVAPDCEVIRFRMTALRSLPKRIICFRTRCQLQRIIKGLWGHHEVFDIEKVFNWSLMWIGARDINFVTV